MESDRNIGSNEEFDRFKRFMEQLVSVPHSEIKARLEEEKSEKQRAKLHPPKRES